VSRVSATMIEYYVRRRHLVLALCPDYLRSSTPTILRTPKSLYASQYRVGAHATTGLGPAVLKV